MTGTYSLRDRLLLTASFVLLLFLGLMGLVLDQAFQRTAEQSVAERLKIQIYGLLSVTEVIEGELLLPEALQEPRFNNPGSGLFALVLGESGAELWRSPSSVDLPLDPSDRHELYLELESGVDRFQQLDGEAVFSLSYKVLWLGAGDSADRASEYVFVVAETLDAYQSQLSEFRNSLWGWLIGVVVLLIAIQALVMKWGLSPLGKLAEDLKSIEDGEEEYLHGSYPREIDGVTRNLNLLLSSERQQREKYRTTLADLAHSLKTPLAILKGSASQLGYRKAEQLEEVRDTIDEQVARMDQIVGYQLERAISDSSNLIKRRIEVAPVLEKLIEALSRVYADKQLDIQLHLEPCTFFGDERDLMELLGNVVDNACKYCRQTVRVTAAEDTSHVLQVIVEDDGQGIPGPERGQVLHRGKRLDVTEPGQGIGLAIVGEIVKRYAGSIELDDSSLGGARLTLSFG